MLTEGQKAPDFSLPGVIYDDPAMYDLHRFVGRGHAALLYFYPADFVPNCEDDLRALSRAGWHHEDGVVVWAISGDSLFAHAAFADRYDVDLPLLSDFHAGISESYYAVMDEWRGHHAIPQRGLCVVDDDWTVRHAWETDDPFVAPDPAPLVGAAETLDELVDARIEPPSVEYRH